MPQKTRRGYWISQSWTYRQLWAIWHGDGNWTQASARAGNSLNHWAISPVPGPHSVVVVVVVVLVFFFFKKRCIYYFYFMCISIFPASMWVYHAWAWYQWMVRVLNSSMDWAWKAEIDLWSLTWHINKNGTHSAFGCQWVVAVRGPTGWQVTADAYS